METFATYLIIVAALVMFALSVAATVTGSSVFLFFIALTFAVSTVAVLTFSIFD